MDNFVGTKLNSRRLARRAKGRMPEVSPLAAYAQLALVSEDQLERGPERLVRRFLSLHRGAGAEPRISCRAAAAQKAAASRKKPSRSDGQGQRAALDSRAWPAPTSPEGWKKERKINNACKSKTLTA